MPEAPSRSSSGYFETQATHITISSRESTTGYEGTTRYDDVASTVPRPYDPTQPLMNLNRVGLPREQQVDLMIKLPSKVLRQLVAEDRNFNLVIQANIGYIVDRMVDRELGRLRRRYQYADRPFIECFQMWIREKGLYTSAPPREASVRLFVQEYCRCHGEEPISPNNELPQLGQHLAKLAVVTWTPGTWQYPIFDTDRHSDERRTADDIKALNRFPTYARIDSKDNYVDDIIEYPEILGIPLANTGPPLTHCPLTELDLPDVGRFEVHRTPTDRQLVSDALGIPLLPSNKFAYYTRGVANFNQVRRAVLQANTLIEGLDKVELLEKVYVM